MSYFQRHGGRSGGEGENVRVGGQGKGKRGIFSTKGEQSRERRGNK